MAPSREYFNNRRQERRKKLMMLLGGQCEHCGSRENLHFDHKDPKKKEFAISKMLDAPESVLTDEVNKCQLLCSDCHREKTREKWEFGSPESKHGTIWRYKKYKCRCNRCRQAMSDYNLARK